jgi:methyl-accepting chemotaxis protein
MGRSNITEVRQGRAPGKDSGPDRDAGQSAEAQLGDLIAAAGKLRMLSHQAVMLGLLQGAQPSGSRGGTGPSCASALEEFDRISNALMNPEQTGDLCQPALLALKQAGAVTSQARIAMSRFRREAHALLLECEVPNAHQLARLADFVATDLLVALNGMVQGIQTALTLIREEGQKEQQVLSGAVQDTVGRIKRLSKSLQVVAINASIEAHRAQSAGAGFVVLSEEMRRLAKNSGEEADALSARLKAVGH